MNTASQLLRSVLCTVALLNLPVLTGGYRSLDTLDATAVAELMRVIGLPSEYALRFQNAQIDGSLLLTLTAQDIRDELGITEKRHISSVLVAGGQVGLAAQQGAQGSSMVLVTMDGTILALDGLTGADRWQQSIAPLVRTPSAAAGEEIVLQALNQDSPNREQQRMFRYSMDQGLQKVKMQRERKTSAASSLALGESNSLMYHKQDATEWMELDARSGRIHAAFSPSSDPQLPQPSAEVNGEVLAPTLMCVGGFLHYGDSNLL